MINCTLNECLNNFVSVIKCYDDYLLFLDNTNKIIVSLIGKKYDNIEKLKFIGSIEFNDVICFTPFGLYLKHVPQSVLVEQEIGYDEEDDLGGLF